VQDAAYRSLALSRFRSVVMFPGPSCGRRPAVLTSLRLQLTLVSQRASAR
jgi:hypothetical protein